MTTYRLYFNRELEWPQCWSIDEGDQRSEINVVGFQIDGCAITSHTLPKELRAVNRFNTPFAWIEVTGYLTFDGGTAIFSSSPHGAVPRV